MVYVELLGVDVNVGYAHAFVAVKELAVKLRAALTSKAPNALQEVRPT